MRRRLLFLSLLFACPHRLLGANLGVNPGQSAPTGTGVPGVMPQAEGPAQFLQEMDYRLGSLETSLSPAPAAPADPGAPPAALALAPLIESLQWDLRARGASPQQQAARHTVLEALSQPQRSLPSVAAALRQGGGEQGAAVASRLESLAQTLEGAGHAERSPLLRSMARLRREFLFEGEGSRASSERVAAYLGGLFDRSAAPQTPLAFADGQIASQYPRLFSGNEKFHFEVGGRDREILFHEGKAEAPSPPVPVYSMRVAVRGAEDALRVYARVAEAYERQTGRSLFPLRLRLLGSSGDIEVDRSQIARSRWPWPEREDSPNYFQIDTSRVNARFADGELSVNFHPGRGQEYESADMLRALARFGGLKVSPAGLYTRLQRRWLPESEFADAVDALSAPEGFHLGALPRALSRAFPAPEEALAAIDGIANALLAHRGEGAAWTTAASAEEVSRKVAPLAVSYVNSGDDGVVYKISAGKSAFALKLYKAHDKKLRAVAQPQGLK